MITERERLSVYGDSAYGTGELLGRLERADAQINCRVQAPHAPGGRFSKAQFTVDLDALTVTCPAAHTVTVRPVKSGHLATFGGRCADCPLKAECTASATGRTIHIGHHEAQLTAARERQADPEWTAAYKATRPKVERKLAHMMRRTHGGRRARVRGTPKVRADFQLLAAATNLARLAVLGVTSTTDGWALITS